MADIVELLIAERDRIDRAIAALGGEAPKRRGRPPGRPKKAVAKRARRSMSPAARKAVSERMKRYWAKRKKAGKRK